ncbi:6593_t:CDS:2 [Paraglomus occultum]|uniref:Cyanocobalamin reductase (cyanide-eliminating) n=1 Tax=Paraglomus occultum TaxID=144539 RepID=A0A9N9FV60_9GLOM|nr:6593_t:CDS:2 [Paraglomus occultum]
MSWLQRTDEWINLTTKIGACLYTLGFDIVYAFSAQRYNTGVKTHAPLTTFDRTNTLAVLVGNTKHLWHIFASYVRHNHDTQKHPLDTYTNICIEHVVSSLVARYPNSLAYDIRYAYEVAPERLVSFQQLMTSASFAYYNPNCFLSIHPKYGPWFGLRAVITIDMEGPAETNSQPPLMNPFPELDEVLARKWEEICKSGVLSSLRSSYEQPNMETDVDAEMGNNSNERTVVVDDDDDIIKNSGWYKLVELRDLASNIQPHPYRYSMNQICYHYTKDPKYLCE